MLEAGLIVSRFLHYTACLTLFGISLFPLYTSTALPGASYSRAHGRTAMWWTTLVALLSAVFWFTSVVDNMTGTLNGFLDRSSVWSVLSETSFGKIWVARFILLMVILAVVPAQAKSPKENWSWLLPTLCAALLVSLAGVGHTQMDDGLTRVVHMSSDGLHLLAAGAWLGGLVSLFSLVARAIWTSGSESAASNAALRFSGMGYIAVATIIGSGLINSWFLVGSFANLRTPYGQLLIVKLVLFAAMLGLAGLNRFFIVPSLIKADEDHAVGLSRLRRHVLGEQALGFLIILIVSALGTMQPAVNPT